MSHKYTYTLKYILSPYINSVYNKSGKEVGIIITLFNNQNLILCKYKNWKIKLVYKTV